MKGFISIGNLKKLFKILNNYSLNKYYKKINIDDYKYEFGKIMEDIYDNFKNKISKEEANKLMLNVCKKILDDRMLNYCFETDEQNINNMNETKMEEPEHLILRNDFEDRMIPILNPNQMNHMDNSVVIKKELDDVKKNFIIRNREQKVDFTKNIDTIRDKLIISPDEYLKTLQRSIIHEDVLIDSRDRNVDLYDSSKYIVNLERVINNLISIEIISAIIPKTEYIINSSNNLLHFEETSGSELIATITPGYYTLSTLATEIQTQMNTVGSSTYNVALNDYQRTTTILSGPDNNRITSSVGTPYKLIDGDVDESWISPSSTASFIYTFETPQVINKYRFICTESNGRPTDWTIEVSNDLVNWYNIDSKSGETITQFIYASYTLPSNSISTKYVRFSITASTAADVHISEFEFFKGISNKYTITSDLTGGSGIFNLLFEGRTVNTGHLGNGLKTLYKENSIGRIIGFLNQDYNNFSSYSSDNEVLLELENSVYLYIKDLNNINSIQTYESDRFALIPFDCNSGEYTYFKNSYGADNPKLNDFVYFSDTPTKLAKMEISFRRYDGSLYNFNGLNHSIYFRIKSFNFENHINYPTN
jgi:hypothetical protein